VSVVLCFAQQTKSDIFTSKNGA